MGVKERTHKEEAQSTVFEALETLRKRLLDTTARNPLINFRHTKKGSLRVIDELPDQLVETLLSDGEMRFVPVPEPSREELIHAGYIEIDEAGREVRLKKEPGAQEWAAHLELSTSYEMPLPMSEAEAVQGKHQDQAIQSLLYPYELEARLKSIESNARSAIQEMGANILYLAFGFLEWFESPHSDKPRLAPLFLVPVRVNKGRLNAQSGTYEYTLSYSGEEILPNLSLREKLKSDFALALPELDDSTRPEAYFGGVAELLEKNQPRWRLRRYISLAMLNFSKLLMYLDLDPARWPHRASLSDHQVAARVLAGYQDGESGEGLGPDLGFGEEHAIDEIEDVHGRYPLIYDADSSQHSALVDALDGKNVVIEGPPGTGKSQTITNLVAAAMAQGKRVLFVAEKMAALEVVQRRLEEAGLGSFCLELHSHKSQKRKILDDVAHRLSQRSTYRSPSEIEVEMARYEELKQELKAHVERINAKWRKTGRSLHEIFMAATRYREELGVTPEHFHPAGCHGDNLDPAAQRRLEDCVSGFADAYANVAAQLPDGHVVADHPWHGVTNADLQLFDLERVQHSLQDWQSALEGLNEARKRLLELFGCDVDALPDSPEALRHLRSQLGSLPEPGDIAHLEALPQLLGEWLNEARRYLEQITDIQALYAELAELMEPGVLSDLQSVDQHLEGSERLQSLVGSKVDLGKLAEAIRRLDAISLQLGELREPVEQIRGSVTGSAADRLALSENGLREFRAFIHLVAKLDASHAAARSRLFDNDELDELLPRLRAELGALNREQSRLRATFRTDELPDATTLRQIRSKLEAGGLFSWLNADWRAARKELLFLAASPRVKIGDLRDELGSAVDFAGRRDSFLSDKEAKERLDERFQGLETDIDRLVSLRDWYRAVRGEYGVGFGQRVHIGDTMLGLPDSLIRAIRSLSDQGVQRQIDDLLEDLGSLKEIFGPVEFFHDPDAHLEGENGLIPQLLQELNESLAACGPLVGDSSISIEELATRAEKISTLRKLESEFLKSDLDQQVFAGELDLKPGLDPRGDNERGLEMLGRTLDVAEGLEASEAPALITDFIRANPEKPTFGSIRELSLRLLDGLDRELETRAVFADLVSLDQGQWLPDNDASISALLARNKHAIEAPEYLQNWLDYVRQRQQVDGMGLEAMAAALEGEQLDTSNVRAAHLAGVNDLLAREILRENPELQRFSGQRQQSLQKQFRRYDETLEALQRERIAWKIDQNEVVAGNASGRVSERTGLGLLQHVAGQQRPRVTLRELLKRSGEALTGLKPCFMMSPMSIAQYLAPGQLEFDLVVMDEASQIKPQDALGAVARGKQLVVVGDPKQLPPTSFFDRMIDDDEDEDPTAIQQSESVLDAGLPMFPARRLRWHYRSQHEELIAFSNQFFYDNDLILFPSPHNDGAEFGIKFEPVPRGCFVNQRNLEEAKVIAEAVREHAKNHRDETLGVVAMSASQKAHVEQAVEVLAKEDPLFQGWLDEGMSGHEPLFVKNLENVQGDERDVIYISMTYGPQEPGGRVMQRFGPINSDVGWRRLNVLFTRSRKRMHVFSSMRADDIVIGPNAKRGVRALRDFLAFCETKNLHTTIPDTGRDPDSDFEISVANALRDEGFECVPQVGVSGFFIDIAVVDPGNPGRYLMGVECDGATYHSAKSVRDRDRLRQSVLERLGWRIRRIWSTDWFKNPRAQLQPIIRELHELKSEPQPEPVADSGSASKDESKQQELPVEAEEDAIAEIVDQAEHDEIEADVLVSGADGMRDQLIKLDQELIRKHCPETAEAHRLLRPAMLEALLEHQPTDKYEFLQLIPSYLRQSTNSDEGRFLGYVFEIINTNQ